MSFCRVNQVIFFVGLIVVSAGNFACAQNAGHLSQNNSDSNCKDARLGTLVIDSISGTPYNNAFLFSCAITAVIGEADQTREQAILLNKRKTEVADAIWVKSVDAKYKNEDGDTLLIALALSFLAEDWRAEKIEKLIQQGVDPNHRNSKGFKALDYARDRKDPLIIKLLSKY